MADHCVLGIGELLWDCFGNTRRPGGALANVAFHATQLGVRGRVCSRVGYDDLGDALLGELSGHGVDTTLIQRGASHPTGTVTVDTTHPSAPTYTIHENAAWDYVEFDTMLEEAAARASAVCFGTLAQRSRQSKETIHRVLDVVPEAMVVYDLNLRPPWYDRNTIESSLNRCTVAKLNEDEAERLADLLGFGALDAADCAAHLLSRFSITLVCVTRGPRGCLLITDAEHVDQPGLTVEVADAVGAGDAFTAALVCGLLWKWPLSAVARFANGVGGLVASRNGAMPDLAEEYRILRESVCT